jgi:hypothetical protein
MGIARPRRFAAAYRKPEGRLGDGKEEHGPCAPIQSTAIPCSLTPIALHCPCSKGEAFHKDPRLGKRNTASSGMHYSAVPCSCC